MPKPQFTITGLLIATALVALSCLELVSPWMEQRAAITVAYLVLVIAAIAAVSRTGKRRAFWCGFLIAGSAYFLANHYFRSILPNGLVTSALLNYVARLLSESGVMTQRAAYACSRIGDAALAILFGYLGGLLGQHLYATRDKPEN